MAASAQIVDDWARHGSGASAFSNMVMQGGGTRHEANADSRAVERVAGCPDIGVSRAARRSCTGGKSEYADRRTELPHLTTLMRGSFEFGSSSMPLMTKPASDG